MQTEQWPSSPIQSDLWKRQGDSASHVAYIAVNTANAITRECVTETLTTLSAEIDILRTAHQQDSYGALWSHVLDQSDISVAEVDWREFSLDNNSAEDLSAQKTAVINALNARSATSPWLAVTLAALPDGSHWMLLALPTLNADRFTLLKLAQTLVAAAEQGVAVATASLLEEPVPYEDLSGWLNDFMLDEELYEARQHWHTDAASAAFSSSLDLARSHKSTATDQTRATHRVALAPVWQALNNFCATQQLSAENVLAATLRRTLNRFGDNLLLAREFDSRQDEALLLALGPLSRTLPMQPETADSALTACQQEQQAQEIAQEYVETYLRPADNAEQSMSLVFASAAFTAVTESSVVVEQCVVNADNSDLVCQFIAQGEQSAVLLDSAAARFETSAIEHIANAWMAELHTLLGLAANSESYEASGEQHEYTGTVVSHFEALISAANEQAMGKVSDADRSLSLAEFNRYANQIAHSLQAQGVTKGQVVGLCVARNVDLIASMLAVSKLGAIYVPIDDELPSGRIQAMLSEAQAKYVLLSERRAELDELADIQQLLIADLNLAEQATDNLNIDVAQSDVAYILYTSGSTGKPKGIAISHGALWNHMQWMQRHFEYSAEDVFLQRTSVSFDASVWECWSPLLAGATLHVASKEVNYQPALLQQALVDHKVSVLQIVPSLLDVVMEQWNAAQAANLRILFCGGEALKTSLAAQAKQHFDCRVVNLYGPSETCIDATFSEYSADLLLPFVPIGLPIDNAKTRVLNNAGELAQVGETGELLIAGAGLFEGYYLQPELTDAATWVDAESNERFYRTGDQVCVLNNGELYFKHRADDQIKLNGYRIELEEIGVLTEQLGLASQAVCLFDKQHHALVLFVRPSQENPLDEQAIAHELAQRLPNYMVPSHVNVLSEFKYLSNGKLDKRGLLAAHQASLSESFQAPEGDTEQRLAEIWAEHLGDEVRIGRQSDFFKIGGHSLLAMKVANQIAAEFNLVFNIRHLFENNQLQQLASYVQANQGSANQTIPLADNSRPLLLSFAQQRLRFIDHLEGGASYFNIPIALTISGPLNLSLVELAINDVVKRHGVFRTTFNTDAQGNDVQTLHNDIHVPLMIEDLSAMAGDEQRVAAEQIVARHGLNIFNLERDILLTATVVVLGEKDGETQHLLLLNSHHIVTDGWSTGLLVKEFAECYQAQVENRAANLAALSIQYTDYAQWQRDQLAAGALNSQIEYWKTQLDGLPAVHSLPLDKQRPISQTFKGESLAFSVSEEVHQQLVNIADQQQTTVFVVLHTLFSVLLSRYSGQSDIVVGTPVANRTHQSIESLIGLFVNLLVLRVQCDESVSFAELISRVRQTHVDALENQDIPFELLVDVLNPERNASFSPLFQVMFSMDSNETPEINLPELNIAPLTSSHVNAKYDLTLEAAEQADGMAFNLIYNVDLFHAETIEKLAAHFTQLLTQVCQQPTQALNRITMLSDAEQQTLAAALNQTQRDYDVDATVHGLIAEQAARTPNSAALAYGEQSLTYAELAQQVDTLAAELVRRGVKSDQLVGVCLERSIEMVVSLLAIMKAGAAYVPLDPSYPIHRLAHMLSDADAQFVITDASILPMLSVPKLTEVIDVSEALQAQAADTVEFPAVSSEQLAYVIYTSGSTGKPKGVTIPHRNVANLFAGLVDSLKGDEQMDAETWLAVTSISFDISVLEIFWPLSRGQQVILAPDRPLPVKPRKAMDLSLFYFAAQDADSTVDKYELLLEGAKIADTQGLKAVWVPERHFNSFGDQFPDPAVAASAVAATTKNITLRAGSVVLPLRDPVNIAEQWSMIDHLSNGRVEIAVASGWHPNDFVLAPSIFNNRHQAMRDKLDELKAFWRGEGVTRENGVGQPTEFFLHPKPKQAELTTWITAANSPDTFRYAGSIGANVLTHLLGQTHEQLAEKVALYRQSLADAGFDPASGRVALMLHTFVSEDGSIVKDTVEQPFKNYLSHSLNLLIPLAEENQMDMNENTDVILDLGFRRYFDSSGLFGTPEECISRVNGFRDLGVDEIACLIDFGIDNATTLQHLPALARLQKMLRQQEAQDELLQQRLERSVAADELVLSKQVTHMQCTPAYVNEWPQTETGQKALGQLTQLLVGGEALPGALATSINHFLKGDLFNMYGPTETTVWSGIQKIAGGDVTIGGPIANTQFYVLDEHQRLVPYGHQGELYIAGDGISPGYFKQRELTEGRFVPNPFVDDPQARMYRTGDLVRYSGPNKISFLGRIDDQVKVSGFRIELGEIEAVMRKLQGVKTAAVALHGDPAQLVGYFVARQLGVSKDGLRQQLKALLPPHMVPAAFVEMEALPLTPNNKIDRNRLPAPDKQDLRKVNYVAPRFQIETDLVNLWQELLQVDQIGIHDDFFELGGNSLLLNRLVIQVNQSYQIKMPLKVAFNNTTIAELAVDLTNLINATKVVDTEEEYEEEIL